MAPQGWQGLWTEAAAGKGEECRGFIDSSPPEGAAAAEPLAGVRRTIDFSGVNVIVPTTIWIDPDKEGAVDDDDYLRQTFSASSRHVGIFLRTHCSPRSLSLSLTHSLVFHVPIRGGIGHLRHDIHARPRRMPTQKRREGCENW